MSYAYAMKLLPQSYIEINYGPFHIILVLIVRKSCSNCFYKDRARLLVSVRYRNFEIIKLKSLSSLRFRFRQAFPILLIKKNEPKNHVSLK